MKKQLKEYNTKKKSDEYGNVMLELALVMPLFLLLLSGIIQFGFILNAKVAVNSASYEASRTATLADNPEQAAIQSIEDYAKSTLPGWSFDNRLKARISISGSDPGDTVSVQVVYKIPVFFAKIFPFSPDGNAYTDIVGESVMQIEEKE
jgi:uncharacterized protein (UPF0333 family)